MNIATGRTSESCPVRAAIDRGTLGNYNVDPPQIVEFTAAQLAGAGES